MCASVFLARKFGRRMLRECRAVVTKGSRKHICSSCPALALLDVLCPQLCVTWPSKMLMSADSHLPPPAWHLLDDFSDATKESPRSPTVASTVSFDQDNISEQVPFPGGAGWVPRLKWAVDAVMPKKSLSQKRNLVVASACSGTGCPTISLAVCSGKREDTPQKL